MLTATQGQVPGIWTAVLGVTCNTASYPTRTSLHYPMRRALPQPLTPPRVLFSTAHHSRGV
jgi:hypothetical protein